MIDGKESWLPLSRGLDKHLPYLSGNAVKVFLHILINAHWFGESKGKYTASINQIATELRMGYMATYNAVRDLNPRHVIFEAGKNQYSSSVFTIRNYKTVKDFGASTEKKANEKPTGGAVSMDFQSEKTNPLESTVENASQFHKNKKNIKEEANESLKEFREILSHYSQPELIEKYLSLFVGLKQLANGTALPIQLKVAILKELNSNINDLIQKGGLYEEESLYPLIEQLIQFVASKGVNLDPDSVGERNHFIVSGLKKISDENLIRVTKNFPKANSLALEVQRRVNELRNKIES